MKLPQHIFFDPQGPLTGAGFILCTSPPFYLGKVYKFRSNEEQESFLQTNQDWNHSNISNYRISIVYYGSLTDNMNKGEIKTTMQNMASFYLQQKILQHEAAFKKYQKIR